MKTDYQKLFRQANQLKLHELLKIGLEALALAEKPDSLVKVDMSVYHHYDLRTNTHYACLGGLAFLHYFKVNMRLKRFRQTTTFGLKLSIVAFLVEKSPGLPQEKINPFIIRFEQTLDFLRQGFIELAYLNWYGKEPDYNLTGRIYAIFSAQDKDLKTTYYLLDKARYTENLTSFQQLLAEFNI